MNKIRYIYKVDKIKGYNYPRYESKNVSEEFVKRYFNVFAILAGLNPCCRDLIDYLAEIMDDDNIVRSDEYTRQRFLIILKEATADNEDGFVTYSDSNIKKAFQILTDRRCLVKLNRGTYKVNPEIFFRKSEVKRLESIKISMEFQRGIRNDDMELVYELNNE